MADSRGHILDSIRAALDKALLPDSTPERPPHSVPRATGGVDAFVDEAKRLSAQVIRVGTPGEAAEAVAALFVERGWKQALTWNWAEIGCEGLAEALSSAGVESVQAGDPVRLASIPVGVTGAEAGLADTGSIVVRNGAGRSPLASLLPPVHVALVDASRIYADMITFFRSLDDGEGIVAHAQAASSLVFISGPSRTADIEQTLTLGVHGPQELILVVWG